MLPKIVCGRRRLSGNSQIVSEFTSEIAVSCTLVRIYYHDVPPDEEFCTQKARDFFRSVLVEKFELCRVLGFVFRSMQSSETFQMKKVAERTEIMDKLANHAEKSPNVFCAFTKGAQHKLAFL